MTDTSRRAHLETGREAYAERAWADAYMSLAAADRAAPLEPDDLELLATSASMTGRIDEYLTVLERIHHLHLDAGEGLRAARAAFWAGMTLATRGDLGPAGGWFARAQRLIEREGVDCVESGYLLVPQTYARLAAGEYDTAYATAGQGREIGDRFNDGALVAVGFLLQGEARVRQGLAEQGLSLLDEAMVAITAPDIPPILTGVIYCGVIACCEDAFDPRRAQEWTSALTRWCEHQPQMVSFTGRCLAHRAGIMQLHGAWDEALAEARLAGSGASRRRTGRRRARRSTSRPSSTGCAESWPPPRRRTQRRAGSDVSHSRGSRSCACDRETPAPRPRRSGASSRARRSRCGARRSFRHMPRPCSQSRTSTRHAGPPTSWPRSPRRAGAR